MLLSNFKYLDPESLEDRPYNIPRFKQLQKSYGITKEKLSDNTNFQDNFFKANIFN